MDNMCYESEENNKSKTITNVNEPQTTSRCKSPVFKCLNLQKPVRGCRSDSSDYDIPSYQVNQSSKSRTSSKYGNDANDISLPVSPVFSPICPPATQFQPPSIHTLGTIGKRVDSNKNTVNFVFGESKFPRKKCNVFESLGMTDKDISWVSSMASPPPPGPGTGFNTIEKATFFPEDKFQTIQPRALFSPTLDDDFGCKPLSFTSESEDEECYKTNVRLSDVCATLKQLDVRSEQSICENDNVLKNSCGSPVIRTKKKKSESTKKKKKVVLSQSPKFCDDYEFSISQDFSDKTKSNVSIFQNFIADDSFQSISFSGIDELCKTLVNTMDSSAVSKNFDCDKTLTNTPCQKLLKGTVKKCFYLGKSKMDVCPAPDLNNLHLYAQALEEADVQLNIGRKLEKNLTDRGFVRFDMLHKDLRVDATKRLHSEASEEKIEKTGKKFKDNGVCNWDEMKEYLSDSQLNVSDSEIFRTVENLEKTLVSQEEKELEKKKCAEDSLHICKIKNQLDDDTIDGKTTESVLNKNKTGFLEDLRNFTTSSNETKPEFSVAFKTALGSSVTVSDSAITKARELFKTCEENSENFRFFTGLSKINVSKEALEKGKTLILDCDGYYSKGKNFGRKIEISPEALEKAKALMIEENNGTYSKTIKVSPEALEKAKNLMSKREGTKLTTSTIKVLPQSLEKAKNLMSEISTKKLGSNPSTGFCTLSGKTIQVSSKALEKAKSLMTECDEISEVPSENFRMQPKKFPGFSTGLGKTIKVSSEALEKAKSLMAKCNENEPSFVEKLPEVKSTNFLKFTAINNNLEKGCSKNFEFGFDEISNEDLEKEKTSVNVPEKLSKGNELPEVIKEDVTFEFSKSSRDKKERFENNIDLTLKIDEELCNLASEDKKSSKFLSMGFMTGLGNKVEVSKESLEKAKAFMSKVDKEVRVTAIEEKQLLNVPATGFCTGLGNKIEVSAKSLEKDKALMSKIDEEYLGLPIKEGKSDLPITEFSTGLGIKESLSKDEAFLSEVEKSKGGPLEKTNLLPQSFLTASGTKATISEKVLTKDQESVTQWEIESSMHIDSKSRTKETLATENLTSVHEKSKDVDIDWDEIIPSWLHVYNTSPSIASDRIELSPIASNTNGATTKCDKEYIIKSPVLGSHDRFYRKIKRKRLQFEEEKSETRPTVLPRGFIVPYKTEKELKTKESMKRTSSVLSLNFSAPFKKVKFENEMTETTICIEDVLKKRAKARSEQEKIAAEKGKVKPLKGSHLLKKCLDKQIKFIEAVNNCSPEIYADEDLEGFGVKSDVLSVKVGNAAKFKFNGLDFFGSSCLTNGNGFPIGDGCVLVPDDENNFGVDEFKRSFLASPGVQPNLVSLGWFENHYKWIIWKLAHYEKSFPRYFAGKCLTPQNAMLQLKYRYDREIDRNERSALKKILERDDTAAKRIVLCVCGIKKTGNPEGSHYELDLTDGWYSCPAKVDLAMTRLIEEEKVTIGTKLVTQGATLYNCEQGMSPLEISSDVYLKISTNSTRRIKWDTKLGFQKNPENLTVSLGSVLPQGGSISRLNIIIVRIYPILYMEKTPDGHHVTRNLRLEEKAEAEYRRFQERKMETMCKEIQSEMQKSWLNGKNNFNNEQIDDYCQLLECSSSSTIYDKNDQLKKEINEKIEEKLKKEGLNKRHVTEFLKMRIVDLKKPDYNNPAVLSFWKPNEEILGMLSEGKAFSITNISLGNSRSLKSIQINTTRSTRIKQIMKSIKYPSRQLTRLRDVSSNICPLFEEVDVVGVVSKIQDVAYGSRLSQVVYLTDGEFNFVGILFWGSCKDYGWENALKLRSVVACSNLQWKRNYCVQEVPSLHVNENSVFTENPKQVHYKEEIDRLKQKLPQDLNSFFSKCDEDLTTKLEEAKWRNKSRNSSGKSFESGPAASSTPIKPLPGRPPSGEPEPSPIQRKMSKLERYGEPPPLLPLIVSHNQRRLKRKT